MQRSFWIIPALFVFAAIGTPTVLRADTLSYTVNQAVGAGSVTGFITTDGTIGTLSAANIVGWDLTMNDGHGDISDLTQSNSGVADVGTALTASSSALMFNFSGSPEGTFSFSSTSTPFTGALCYDSGTNCAIPAGIDLYDVAGVLPCAYYGCDVGETGNQVIATATPEPATAGLALIGLGLSVLMRKRLALVLPTTTGTHRTAV